ncbi:MAG: hypothetical protein H6698_05910 [Myxococcales bacterium]|nr:hypothetical protein [Myxococcales bacterium]MCB9532014.1 hypothetical protein [Myxococcales bacterium]MCB9533840.1 hypothetical protein [Myxococcales bacterium]
MTRMARAANRGAAYTLNAAAPLAAMVLAGACGTSPVTADLAGGPAVIGADADDFSLDTGGVDPGPVDTGTRDDTAASDDVSADLPLLDARPDAPVGSDTSPADGGELVCPPGASWCEGDILYVCSADGGEAAPTRCARREEVCVVDDAGARCAPPDGLVCTPGETRCESTLAVSTCLDDGSEFGPPTRCELGCDPATQMCAAEPPAGCSRRIPTIHPGETVELDLCDYEDSTAPIDQADCGDAGTRSGGDATYALVITSDTRVTIDLRDDDDSVAIDTVLYVRRACEDDASQLACSDDIPCDESDVTIGSCSGGVQVRQSRVTLSLAAGTYYVVADHLEYGSFSCGSVRLQISR